MTHPRDVRQTGRTREYWESAGAAHTFTHPLDPELLAAHLPVDGRILDYGCGYGRLVLELTASGYRDVRGVDPSAALIARGLAARPELRLTRMGAPPLPFADASFDAALLFAVLTSAPDPVAQESAVAELARLVRPGGVVYVSDVPLQTDERSRDRYRAQEASTGTYGVFRIEDGGTFQHQPPERFHELFGRHGFTAAEERRDVTPTLDGGTDLRVQLIMRRAA
ncbi:methyltransferase domain-containing protein [Streptomyces sp. NPDC050617]|uniref:class I SAM-dependent methyltransferase n=1 Tax=Streptomyces sp. NPDC050617 TaxID=3154628 RepID=UPI003448C910